MGLAVTIILQIITGIFLALHYTSDLNSAYFSIFFFIREIYYGWSLRYLHSSGASFVFLFQFLHLGRAISYGSYFYNPNTWFSGILLLNGYSIYGLCITFWTNEFLGSYSNYKFIISFSMFSRMGLWGILCSQSNIEEVLSLSFSTPISPLWFIVLHLFYLHFHSSNNPLRLNTNNKIPFFPFILLKDFVGLILVLCLYFLQTHFGISSLSHPDNALEDCALLTPLHIVPEWYFLCQYAILKAVPNKNAGFIILLTSIFALFFFG